MMEEKPKTASGPAFPWHQYGGMSLRDYFAAAALQGICGGVSVNGLRMPDAAYPDMIAKDAFELADAMLKERAK